jgi:hypothetical protein
MEHPKNQGVTFWTERIRLIIIKIWHQLQNLHEPNWFCNWCHILIIISPILSVQNVTPRFLGCFIFPNILVIYQTLFLTLFQISKNIGHRPWQHYLSTSAKSLINLKNLGKKKHLKHWKRERWKTSGEKETIILFTGILFLKELPIVSTPNLTKLCPTPTIPVFLASTKLLPKTTFEPSSKTPSSQMK